MNRQVRSVPAGGLLRVQASSRFVLHWSNDGWKTAQDTTSTPTAVGVEFADIQVAAAQSRRCSSRFFWPQDSHWQGQNFEVEVTRDAKL